MRSWPIWPRRCRSAIVLLSLHGAMIAEGYTDAEGDLLKPSARAPPDRIRQLVSNTTCMCI